MKKSFITAATLAAVIAGPLAVVTETALASNGKEKCYGVSKAGQNDCGNLAGTHSCAAQSTVDNDIGEWKLVESGTCKALDGYSKAEAKELYQAQLEQN
jgi:uncharacterized membrane protein